MRMSGSCRFADIRDFHERVGYRFRIDKLRIWFDMGFYIFCIKIDKINGYTPPRQFIGKIIVDTPYRTGDDTI